MNMFWILGGLGFTALALMLFHEHAYSRGKQEGEELRLPARLPGRSRLRRSVVVESRLRSARD
jgi:hypothetical protein